MSAAPPQLSVVAPLRNEAGTVEELAARLVAVLDARGESFEIVLVDDGSTDGTPALLDRLRATTPAVRAIRLSRSFGQGAALCCGIFESRGAVVVTMDGDLQNPPEEIPRLLDALGPGVDLVTARRAERHETTWRWLASRAIHWIARSLIGGDLQDYGGQFKAYRREAIEATRTAWTPGTPFFALAVWLGFRVVEVSVRHDTRKAGESRYDVPALIRLSLDLITSFTTLPLAALGAMGLLAGSAGVAGVVWCMCVGATSGFAAALSLLLLGLGGVFVAAGTLGVYVARLYRNASVGPTGWVVRRSDE